MLRDLVITNLRGFRKFAMSGLGRVNLLVGTNNCGKTSVLEAIHLLSVPGNPLPLWEAQFRRGELIEVPTERVAMDRQIDVSHLIHGHELQEDAAFAIEGEGTAGRQALYARVRGLTQASTPIDDESEGSESAQPPRAAASLRLDWSIDSSVSPGIRVRLPLSRQGGVAERRIFGPRVPTSGEARSAVSFIASEGLTRDAVISMFESVVLTADEATVLQALRTIEPQIERIASVGTYARSSSRDVRGGLAMMVSGQRIPIGSMGDGIWRLLGIALALVRARGGVFLVDEVDTGLHYSVLVDMWRLVFETARSLDVQVFATTHSRDCYEALATVAEPGRTEISLQRIERGKAEAVAFSELEIRQAAERGLEVR